MYSEDRLRTYVHTYVRTYVRIRTVHSFTVVLEQHAFWSSNHLLIYSCSHLQLFWYISFRIFFDFFGVENPLDVIFVMILRFFKTTDYATRLLAVFCFRWTYSQPCTHNNGQTSVLTNVVLCMAGRAGRR